jgi:putative DNA primase/helicase
LRIHELDPDSVGAERDSDSPDSIPYLRFDPFAQLEFDQWRAKLELRIRSGDEHEAFESHLAKYRSLIPSLALLIHLADVGRGPVGLEALQKAIDWGEYLESHARRLYSSALSPGAAAAKELAKKIKHGDIGSEFAIRDVYRKGWTGLSERAEVEAAVDVLVGLDWLRVVQEQTDGRPRERYLVNPKIWQVPNDAPDNTDKSMPEVSSVGSVSSLCEAIDEKLVVAAQPKPLQEVDVDEDMEVLKWIA